MNGWRVTSVKEFLKLSGTIEDELREKSARLNQLNRELERSNRSSKEQSQDGEDEPDAEGGKAPAPVRPTPPRPPGDKPSIRQALRDYTPPAPAPPRTDRSQQRGEAAL